MNLGIVASAVHIASGPCTSVLREPFENLTAWTPTGSGNSIVAGRTGTAAQVSGTTSRLNYTIPSINEDAVVTVGFAFRTPVFQSSGNTILTLASDTNVTTHTRLWVRSDGAVGVDRTGTNLATTAAGVLAINTWYYLEMQAKLHDTTGFVIVRVNGTEVVNISAVDTKNAGTKTVYDAVRLGVVNGATGGTNLYDDLYITTGSGCAFQGDQTICNEILLEPFNDLDVWGDLDAGSSITAGRSGTCLRVVSGSGPEYVIPPIKESISYTVGFAWRASSLATAPYLVGFTSSDTGGSYMFRMQAGTDGSLSVQSGQTSAAGVIVANTWAYVEAKFTLSNTAGTLEVRVNGSTVIGPFTSIDTNMGFVEGTAPQALVLPAMGATTLDWDDLYLSSGGCGFKGDIVIADRVPPLAAQRFKAALGNSGNVVNGTSLVISTIAPIAVGDLVVVRVAADNLSATTPTISCTDSGGNSYTSHAFQGQNATAALGVVGGILATKATNAVAIGGTITITLSGSVIAKAAYAESFVGFNNTLRNASVVAGGAGTGAAVTSGSANPNDLVIGAVAAESRLTSPTTVGDVDTAGGEMWSRIIQKPCATAGTDDTRVQVNGQYKIVVSAGTQTYNNTLLASTDWAALVAIFQAA
jgi:hypothetical protein